METPQSQGPNNVNPTPVPTPTNSPDSGNFLNPTPEAPRKNLKPIIIASVAVLVLGLGYYFFGGGGFQGLIKLQEQDMEALKKCVNGIPEDGFQENSVYPLNLNDGCDVQFASTDEAKAKIVYNKITDVVVDNDDPLTIHVVSENNLDNPDLIWNFDDGEIGANTKDTKMTHTYEAPGKYLVRVSSSIENGDVSGGVTGGKWIQVGEAEDSEPLTFDLNCEQNEGSLGAICKITNIQKTGGDIGEPMWIFDGEEGQANEDDTSIASHIFSEAGNHKVEVVFYGKMGEDENGAVIGRSVVKSVDLNLVETNNAEQAEEATSEEALAEEALAEEALAEEALAEEATSEEATSEEADDDTQLIVDIETSINGKAVTVFDRSTPQDKEDHSTLDCGAGGPGYETAFGISTFNKQQIEDLHETGTSICDYALPTLADNAKFAENTTFTIKYTVYDAEGNEFSKTQDVTINFGDQPSGAEVSIINSLFANVYHSTVASLADLSNPISASYSENDFEDGVAIITYDLEETSENVVQIRFNDQQWELDVNVPEAEVVEEETGNGAEVQDAEGSEAGVERTSEKQSTLDDQIKELEDKKTKIEEEIKKTNEEIIIAEKEVIKAETKNEHATKAKKIADNELAKAQGDGGNKGKRGGTTTKTNESKAAEKAAEAAEKAVKLAGIDLENANKVVEKLKEKIDALSKEKENIEKAIEDQKKAEDSGSEEDKETAAASREEVKATTGDVEVADDTATEAQTTAAESKRKAEEAAVDSQKASQTAASEDIDAKIADIENELNEINNSITITEGAAKQADADNNQENLKRANETLESLEKAKAKAEEALEAAKQAKNALEAAKQATEDTKQALDIQHDAEEGAEEAEARADETGDPEDQVKATAAREAAVDAQEVTEEAAGAADNAEQAVVEKRKEVEEKINEARATAEEIDDQAGGAISSTASDALIGDMAAVERGTPKEKDVKNDKEKTKTDEAIIALRETEKATADKAAAEKATAEKATAEKAAAEKAAAEKVAAKKDVKNDKDKTKTDEEIIALRETEKAAAEKATANKTESTTANKITATEILATSEFDCLDVIKSPSEFVDSSGKDETVKFLSSLSYEGKPIFQGFIENGKKIFGGERYTNRAEILKTLLISSCTPSNLSLDNVSSFKDIKENNWFRPYVGSARKLNIIEGFGDNTFRPEQKVTRIEAIKMMARIAGISKNTCKENPFADVSKEHWGYEMSRDAYCNNIVEGVMIGGKQYLLPDEPLTRSELAKLLKGYYSYMIK